MPLDSAHLDPSKEPDSGLIEAVLQRLPDDVRASFSPEQRMALKTAAGEVKWGRHPVDVRLSIPLFFTRVYCVLLAGNERRAGRRRAQERRRHPLLKPGNLLFFAGVAIASLYLSSLFWSLMFKLYFAEAL